MNVSLVTVIFRDAVCCRCEMETELVLVMGPQRGLGCRLGLGFKMVHQHRFFVGALRAVDAYSMALNICV